MGLMVESSLSAQTSGPAPKDEVTEVAIPFDLMCSQFRSIKPSPTPKPGNQECSIQETPGKSSSIQNLNGALTQLQEFKINQDALNLCSKVDRFGKVTSNYKFEPPSFEVKDQNNKRWKFKFYFGNSKTYYSSTNAHIKTSRLDLNISNLQPYERRSDSYYRNFFHESAQEMAQIIDEPTNTFTFALVKDKNEIFLKIFHPKFVFAEGDQTYNGHAFYNNNVHAVGTADGQAINGDMPLRPQFDENHQMKPGTLGVVSWENSHKLLQPEVGYGREFTLIKSKGQPILKYTPEVGVGLFLGEQNASYIGKSGYEWDVESYSDGSNSNKNIKLMGYSASVAQRLELNNRKDNVGAFVEHKFSYGKMDYAFLDGKTEHDLMYNSFTVGLSVKVFTLPKKKSDSENK